ncbi:MAG: hypothetical protein VZS44_04300 [Bacilli bacterium]|nr:hypothetical protein [Bacilli bacterium]
MKKRKRKNKKKAKLVINKQKIFSFISFVFIMVCIFWYGGRTIYFYLDSKKTIEKQNDTLAKNIITTNLNTNNFKKINNNYYFQNDTNKNYLIYSNIIWRIIKVTNNKDIVLIADDTITNLAYGKNKKYHNSYLIKWLNKDKEDYTGILENNLNNKTKYLTKTETCIDNISNIKKITCNKTNKNNYISLLSINDYINTGAEKSFINNEKYNYLANTKGSKIWYIDDNGKLNSNNGEVIYGIKPVITLKNKIKFISGDGTENNPYIVEKETKKFGSYVKLDEDIWRIYEDNDENYKLVLNDYIKVDDEKLEYIYSNDNFYHNDTTYGSLAHYLNHKYLYSLSYNNIIESAKYHNSYYGKDNNYDYSSVMNTTIDTKVGLLSIGDPIINNSLDNYFILTGPEKDTDEIYLIKKDSTLETAYTTDEAYVVPTITISKSILTQGKGTSTDPYRTE